MLLKGALLREMYPEADMRLMGDVDILIKSEQYDGIRQIMLDLGFEEKKVHAMQVLSQLPSISSQTAAQLVEMGITSLEAFEGVTEGDLVACGITAEEASAILREAKEVLNK